MKMSAVLEEQRQGSTEQNMAPKCSEHPSNCEVVIKTAGTRVVDTHFSFRNHEDAKKFIKQHSQICYGSSNFEKHKRWTEASLREETKSVAVNQEDEREDLENLGKLHTSQSH